MSPQLTLQRAATTSDPIETMSATPNVTTESTSIVNDLSTENDFNSIGIEFEYPVATTDDPLLSSGDRSNSWRSEGREKWGRGEGNFPYGGHFGSDHTGVEIRSPVFDLASQEMEEWYRAAIEQGHEDGYPFAMCGTGQTSFGLHNHISSLTREEADYYEQMSREPWMRVFVCASITETSLDPWRHGGVRLREVSGSPPVAQRTSRVMVGPLSHGEDGHYEWRMPEPVAPEHLDLIAEFHRRFAEYGPENAEQWAYEKVIELDDRLTAVQQYRAYDEAYEDWPNEKCFMSHEELDDDEHYRNAGDATDRAVAEWFHDLMEA